MTVVANAGLVARLTELSQQRRTHAGVAYRSFGDGPPLLLLHGNVGSWMHWAKNIEALSRRNRVVVLDLPGFGDSISVPRLLGLDDYVSLLEKAVDEILGEKPRLSIIGFSFGGAVAGCLASKVRHRLDRLALLAPSGFEKPAGRVLQIPVRTQFEATSEGQHEFTTKLLLSIMLIDPKSVDEEAVQIQETNTQKARFDGRQISWSGRMLEFLQSIDSPTLLMFGDKDPFLFPSAEARISACAAASRKLEVDIVKNAGHWLQYEFACYVNDRLCRFIEKDRE